MREPGGARRRSPAWWDHQRHTLVALRRSIEDVIASHLPPTRGERVVDLGCGDRPYEPLFLARECQYVPCDLDGVDVVRMEPGRRLPLEDGSADGVVSFQVLEHVWDLDWYLGEAHRLLKPGGWLLLSTHGTWLYHPHPSDYRRWTREGLVRELEARGFHSQAVSAVVGPLAWTTQFRLLGLREALFKIPVAGRFLFLPLACIMNLRMVAEDWITPDSVRDVNASVYVTISRKQPAR